MLFIVMDDGTRVPKHIGEEMVRDDMVIFNFMKHDYTIDDVLLIQADGDELRAIERNFVCIPKAARSGKMFIWFGDMAKTILTNWDLVEDE